MPLLFVAGEVQPISVLFLLGSVLIHARQRRDKHIQGQIHSCAPLTDSSPSLLLSISNQDFNLRADSAHATAADLARHHGRITSHNYTAIMSKIKSALFLKKKKKSLNEEWEGGMEIVGASVSLRGLVTVL